jgi:acyl-CoA synthetase (AMP-forming)/AMP-acid ligase II
MLRPDGLSHWIPGLDEQPALRRLTCGGLLDDSVRSWPDHDALVYCAYGDSGPRISWSFGELRDRVRLVARALFAQGLRPGDRLALWATNVPEWILLQFGCSYAGVVLVPLNPLYRSAEVAYVLRRSQAAALVVEPANRGVSLWDLAQDAVKDAPDVRAVIALGDDLAADGGIGWSEFLAGAATVDDALLDVLNVAPEDPAQIQFTSGTTGFPKGAMLRHGALTDNARLFAARAELPTHGGLCSGMPQFHCGGSVLATMGAFAVGSALMPLVTFDARRAIDTIDAQRARVLAAVPAMLLAIEGELERGGGSLASLERVCTGGSLVPPEIGRRWHERFGVTFTITYGLTEASPVITQSSPADSLELQIGTVGRPLPHVECDVADLQTGRPVPVGERGEVRVRGWQVMAGYFGDPDATREAITADGWLRTGDLGQFDGEGYLRITGRAKDMIIRGGENIYPAEIEAALRQIDVVTEAVVIGVPDERFGEVPTAFVSLSEGAELTIEGMRAALDGRLARFKVPAHLRIVDGFPMTPSGKVQKYKLLERFTGERVAASAGAAG